MKKVSRKSSIAYFISPHGYGHAARAAAVMEFSHRLDKSLKFEIFTLVPEWFFRDSLEFSFGYHQVLTDIGMTQKTPTVEDPSSTAQRLAEFMPFEDALLDRLARKITGQGCRLVICDISPLGIAVAKRAGVPSLLIENFTWDWIYEAYVRYEPELRRHSALMKQIFGGADHHIQTVPLCRRDTSALLIAPVSRSLRRPPAVIRQSLQLPSGKKVVMLTMGGMSWNFPAPERLKKEKQVCFIMLGAVTRRKRDDNLILLPHRSGFFHPDLINACDAVISKAGYSTVAEAFQAGVPFGCIEREMFPESKVLASFVSNEMNGLIIGPERSLARHLVSITHDLLAMSRGTRHGGNGGQEAAEIILGLLAP